MSKWTKWRKLAKGNIYFTNFDNPSFSCYELGLKTSQGETKTPVYVGYTTNEDKRMEDYGCVGSHLKKIIDSKLGKGFILYYRAQAKKTSKQAKRCEKKLLSKHYYCWNTQLK